MTVQWFSPGPPVSSTNKIDRNDMTESGIIKHHQINKPNRKDESVVTGLGSLQNLVVSQSINHHLLLHTHVAIEYQD